MTLCSIPEHDTDNTDTSPGTSLLSGVLEQLLLLLLVPLYLLSELLLLILKALRRLNSRL